MSDFNIRLLGKQLTEESFTDNLLQSRLNKKVISVVNYNDPTLRTLKYLNLSEYLQAYEAKSSDGNSLPIASLNTYVTQSGITTYGVVMIQLTGSLTAFTLEVSATSNQPGSSYCIARWDGSAGTYIVLGNDKLTIGYDSSTNRIYLGTYVPGTIDASKKWNIKINSIKVSGSAVVESIQFTSDAPQGTIFKVTSINGVVGPSAFKELPIDEDLSDLDNDLPSIVVADAQNTSEFYLPTRTQIYGAINKTRNVIFDISNGDTITPSNVFIEGSSVKLSDWDGDVTVFVTGNNSTSNLVTFNSTSINKPPRKLTIINNSNLTIQYYYAINTDPVDVYPGMVCEHNQSTSNVSPTLYDRGEVSYTSKVCRFNVNDTADNYIDLLVTLPKLTYIKDSSTLKNYRVPTNSNVLKFGTIPGAGTLDFGILYVNDGINYFCKMKTIDVTQGYPPTQSMVDMLSMYADQPQLLMSSIDWNSNYAYGKFKFEVASSLDVSSFTLYMTISQNA